MALVACPECSTQVSDQAFKCPSCGKQIRKPKRSFMGKLFKYGFVAFNVLMLIWLVGGYNAATRDMAGMTGAESAGAAIGTGLGVAFILGIWIIGDMFLGLFVMLTRPKY